MTYTSYDGGAAGSGGWQVKEHRACTERDLEDALARVATSLTPVEPVPPFPSTSDLLALPRRLCLDRSASGTWLLTHTALAGSDASGRPGNVFNDVLVLTAPTAPEAGSGRPLSLWRSPGWLTPWGPDQVRDAHLPVDLTVPPARSPQDARRATADFLSAQDRRHGIGALLDAVAARWRGGRPVVVLFDDQETGVRWLEAVTHLLGPWAATSLTFSTWERAPLAAAGRLPVVCLVPVEDAPYVTDAGVVVLRPDLQAPAVGGSWPDSSGTPAVPAGPWSALASTVCALPAAQLLDRLVAVQELAELNPRVTSDAGFPLGLAVAEWQMDAGGAERDVLLGIPVDLLDDDAARQDVRLVQADAVQGDGRSVALRLATVLLQARDLDEAAGHVAALLADLPPGPADIGESDVPTAGEVAALTVRTVLASLLADGSSARADRAQRLLRALDLPELLGVPELLGTRDTADAPELAAAVRQLTGRSGLALAVAGDPPALRPTAAGHLAAALEAEVLVRPGRVGQRLAPAARDWCLATLDPHRLPDGLLAELAVAAGPGHPEYAAFRADAVAALVEAEGTDDPESYEDLRRAFVEVAPWTPAELQRLHARVGPVAGVDAVGGLAVALGSADPGTPRSRELAHALLDLHDGGHPLDRGLRSLAEVCAALPLDALCPPEELVEVAADVLEHGADFLVTVPADDVLAEALLPHVFVALVVLVALDARGDRPSAHPRYQQRVRGWWSEVLMAREAGVPLLLEAMRHSRDLEGAVIGAVSRAELGLPVQGVLPQSLWREPVDGDPARRLGLDLLHRHLAPHEGSGMPEATSDLPVPTREGA